MQKLETELASLRDRAAILSNRHAAADAALIDAKSKLRRHLMEADLDAEEKATAKLEAAVAACALTGDGLADVLAEVRKAIAAAEQKLAAERARQKAETEKAKQQVLESVRTSGKLRRLLGLGGD